MGEPLTRQATPRTAATAAYAVLDAQRSTFESALTAMREGPQVEALHDLRVALRRSRTVLSQLGDALGANDAAALRAELAWLTRATGPARDIDVYLEHLPQHAAALSAVLRNALEPLHAFVRKRREVERVELMRALKSRRTAALLAAWSGLARRPVGAEGGDVERRVVEVTGARVARRYDKLMAHHEHLREEVTPQRLHALRKSAKKLRYLLELLAEVRPSEDGDKLVKRLKRLQDVLGRHHDLHVHGEITLQLVEELAAAGGAGPRTLAAGGALAQVMLAEERRCARECLRALERMAQGKVRRRVARLSPGGGVSAG